MLNIFFRKSEGANQMSFLDHLESLRWVILRSFLATLVFGIVLFLNKSFIFDTIIFAPKRPDFITYKLMCRLGKIIGMENFCLSNIDFDIITLFDVGRQNNLLLKQNSAGA